MGKKLLVSMALEGKFSDSGLQAMDDGADVLTTLARELVMHQGVGQSADEVWRALRVQQPQSQTPEPTAPEPVAEPPRISVPAICSSLVFGQDVPQVCRAAQSHFRSFFGFFGSTHAVLTSPGAGIHSEDPEPGGRRSECAFSKDKNGGFYGVASTPAATTSPCVGDDAV